MADLDLNDLAVFVRVVERGGFAKAAREIKVPTSTVSRTVARLESLFGARLLHRTTRAVQLTSDGRELYESVAPSVKTLEQASRALEPQAKEPRGLLRVTAPNDIGSTFLASLVVDFTAKYPGIRVDLLLTNRTVNLVDEGVDVGLRAGRLADSSLVARKIGDLEAVLYASPAYLQAHGAPREIDDLGAHKLVVFRAKDNHTTWPLSTMSAPKREESVDVHGHIGGDDFTFVRSALLSGGGIGVLPRIVGAEDEAEGRLVRVLPDWDIRTGALFFVYPSARQVPARVSAFRDFVVQAFAERISNCERAQKKRSKK